MSHSCRGLNVRFVCVLLRSNNHATMHVRANMCELSSDCELLCVCNIYIEGGQRQVEKESFEQGAR